MIEEGDDKKIGEKNKWDNFVKKDFGIFYTLKIIYLHVSLYFPKYTDLLYITI